MSSKKKVGIIGLGPIGMILSVHLQEAGCEVAIFDIDTNKINTIKKEGIFLENIITKHAQFKHVCTSVEELNTLDLDVWIFATKVPHMQNMLADKKFTFKKNIYTVSAQNGLDSEKILSSIFGISQTARMVINFAGNSIASNRVKVTFFNPPNYIAAMDDADNTYVLPLAEYFNDVSLQTRVIDSSELIKRVWEKTILNSSLSALCGIAQLTMKEVMDSPETVSIVEQTIQESIKVAEAEKIHFDDDFFDKSMNYLKKAGAHFPSMAVDIINHRNTEIDFFNGKIVEYGRKHNIPTPMHLLFTNTVKTISKKNWTNTAFPNYHSNSSEKGIEKVALPTSKKNTRDCYLGIDLGSAYTKLVLTDDNNTIVFKTVHSTMQREQNTLKNVLEKIRSEYNVQHACATGYGRKHFPDADIVKTEIHCAATGVSNYVDGVKSIIDIGGEDIKIIKCDSQNQVENFYLNSKCAAGTGSFITEIAERATIDISEMSHLAEKSNFMKELNSFCTVFAKTEIMGWLFDGIPAADIARGIYISIINRIAKLRIDSTLPVYLIGGVIAHHPFLQTLLEEKFKQKVYIVDNPQYVVAYGASLLAKKFKHELHKFV